MSLRPSISSTLITIFCILSRYAGAVLESVLGGGEGGGEEEGDREARRAWRKREEEEGERRRGEEGRIGKSS